MLPAYERLDRRQAPVRHRDDGLVEQSQLAALEPGTEVGLQRHAVEQANAHLLIEELVAVAAALLGAGQRHIRVAQQRVGVGGLRLIAVGERDPDARGQQHLLVLDEEWRSQSLVDLLRDGDGVAFGGEVLAQDDELVPAGSGQRAVAAPALLERQNEGQPLRDQDQQFVPVPVVERVVCQLEVVEIDEQGGHEPGTVARALEGVAGALAQEVAIGKSGQPVVERLVSELTLGPLALARLLLAQTSQPALLLAGAGDPQIEGEYAGDSLQQPTLAGRERRPVPPSDQQPSGDLLSQRSRREVHGAELRQRGVRQTALGRVDKCRRH